MRILWNVIAVFVVIHAVALVMLVGWLRQSDRLNWDRVRVVRDMFRLTVAQQEAQFTKAAKVAEQARDRKQELARIQSLETGPLTVVSRLEIDRATQELALASLHRYKDDMQVLRDQIDQGQRMLHAQQQKIKGARDQFDDEMKRLQEQQKSADFRKTVRLFEQIKPKQAKKMFQEMLSSNRQDQVVTYLATMNHRKAAKVLKQFTAPEEIVQATKLIERLRSRGVQINDLSAVKDGTNS